MLAPGVVIVGASAAGLTVAQCLRQRDYRGPVTLLGAEAHLPYDRPSLSKQVLAGTSAPQTTLLCSPAQLGELDIDLVLADPAVALDIGRRTVCTTAGKWAAEHIVIATGAIPRMLPNVGAPAGLHVLRTLEDAAQLRSAVTENTRVVIVGDGVLGTEIAATAAGLSATVSLIGRQRLPMAGPLGDVGGALLAQIHTEHGVNLHPQSTVRSFTESNGAVTGVVLDGGAILPADVVVVAIGATPATRWLTGSGLRIADGVICDANCAVAQGMYAAGDVARFYHRGYHDWIRLGNRTNAAEQAAAVADNILGASRTYTPLPYFWTDQYDTRIQVHGTAPGGAEFVVVDGDVSGRRFVGQWRHRGQTTGILGWNMAKQTRIRRQRMTADTSTP
jgi:NADPH-dependent 2,4-dienoyl-CoA reductase/sulfur reductase-like enzyme